MLPLDQIVSLVGACLILLAFTLNTMDRVSNRSPLSLWLNLVGAGALTYTAVVGDQYGFIVLEATWALVAFVGLTKARRGEANA